MLIIRYNNIFLNVVVRDQCPKETEQRGHVNIIDQGKGYKRFATFPPCKEGAG